MAHNSVGDLITAVSFNTVVDSFNVLWEDPKDGSGNVIVYTYDNALHQSQVDRRYGWGLTAANATVVAGNKVLANDYNKLTAYINSGEYHREDANATMQPMVANVNQDILANDLNKYETLIDDLKATTKKFDLGADATLTPTVLSISNGGTPWGTADLATALTRGTLTCELKYTWSSYTLARHFFNSGGQCIIDMEAVGGLNGSTEWDYVFDSIDSIFIGGKTTYSGGPIGTGVKSFYEITDTYVQVFNAIGFNGAYAGAYTGSGGGYSTYGGREVTVFAKLGMDGTDFVMTVKVVLTEDADDVHQVDCNITLYGGHKVAVDSPNSTYMSSSNASNHQVGGVNYIFTDRTATLPAVAQVSAWTYSS